MTSTRVRHVDARGAILTALFSLFFIQFVTIWFENIYRLSLIKLGPGKEMLGLLFVLLPLVLLFAGKGARRGACIVSVLVVLAARALCPFFGAHGLIVTAGLGVGAFLVLLCCVLSGTPRLGRGSVVSGLGLAVLLSVAFRAWGSSFDVSMGRQGAMLAWILVGLAFLLLRSVATSSDEKASAPSPLVFRMKALLVVVSGVTILCLQGVARNVWGPSFDESMGWQGAMLAYMFVAFALLVRRSAATWSDEKARTPATFGTRMLALIVLFSSATIIYFVLSSPAVVNAWSGSNHLVGTGLLAVSFVCALGWYAAGMPGPVTLNRGVLVALNVAFVACLLLGIKLHTVAFPSSPTSPAVFVTPTGWVQHLPFYAMFVLSPVVVLNMLVAVECSSSESPRGQVLPVMVATRVLLGLAFVLTFTNIWGYMGPISRPLRNRFYLPFLIAGAGMVLPLLLPVWGNAFPLWKTRANSMAPVIGALAIGILAIIGVAFRGARSPEDASSTKMLTVLTYNIQQGSEREGDRNFHDQLAFIRKVNPDLIGLQESDGTRPSGANIDAARFFADALGFYAYYGPNTISGTYGTAILSRFPLENPRTFFTYSTRDEVGTAMAEIDVGGRRIAFFNSHPAGRRDVMLAHAEALVKECANYEHVISVGDYNSRPTSPAYAVVAEALSDSWLRLYPDGVGNAHPFWRGEEPDGDTVDMKRRIDHIFVSPGFNVEESYNVLTPDSETDHPAHWSVLGWE